MERRKRLLLTILALALAAVCAAPNSQASTVVINLDQKPLADEPTPSGSRPWLVATFSEGTYESKTGVWVTLQANFGTNEFVGGNGNGNVSGNSPNGWFFNFTPDKTVTNLQAMHVSGPKATLHTTTGRTFPPENTFDSFDLWFTWNTEDQNGEKDRLNGGETTKVFLYGIQGLTPEDFNVANGKDYYSAAHVQEIMGNSSGSSAKIGAKSASVVPIPGTAFLLGSGMLGLLGLRRRTNRKPKTED